MNCLGIRRDESAAPARRVPWRRNHRMSVAGREVFDWLPIFDLSTADVFDVIRDAGQSPHWIYNHLSRCSCCFCIFSSPRDLRRAAELRPGLYARYAQIAQRIGHTLSPSGRPLPELTGIPLDRPDGIVKLIECRLFSAFLHEAKLLNLRGGAIDNVPRFRSESG